MSPSSPRRSYGHSEGSPSEKGIKLDAQTALDFVLSHKELEKTPIFLYGQSIGGAVAIFLASQNARRASPQSFSARAVTVARTLTRVDPTVQVRGLIIENTFLSLVSATD